jgi:hypothetical protein
MGATMPASNLPGNNGFRTVVSDNDRPVPHHHDPASADLGEGLIR